MSWNAKKQESIEDSLPKIPPTILFVMSIIVLTLSIIASFNPLTFDPIFILFGLLSLGVSIYLIWFYDEEEERTRRKGKKRQKNIPRKEMRRRRRLEMIKIPEI